MALVIKDRVKEQTTTTGTGSVTLGGAVSGFETFSAVGDGNTTYYAIVHQTADEWEVGLGTYTAAGTLLSRDTILESSNSDAAVVFSAGTKDVFVTYPSDKAVYADAAGEVSVTRATSATFATSATEAATAIFATSATNATNAVNVDGGTVSSTDGTFNTLVVVTSASVGGGFNVGGNIQLQGAILMDDANVIMARDGTSFRMVTNASLPIEMRTVDAQPVIIKTTNTERMRINSSGNVGINVSAPHSALEVNTVASTPYQVVLGNSGQTNFLWGIGREGVSTGNLEFRNTTDGFSSSTVRMSIAQSGNVGIGTSSPDFLLDVAGRVGILEGTNGIAFHDGAGSVSAGVRADSGDNLIFATGSSDTEVARFTSSGDFEMAAIYGPALRNVSPSSTTPSILVGKTDTDTGLGSPTGDNLSLITGGSERVRIDSSGNVAVGRTSSVNGAKVTVETGASTPAVLGYGDRTWLNAYDPNSGGTPVDLRLWAYGNSNATNDAYVGTWSAHPLKFATGGSIRATIDTSGNVGIGTSSPAQKLSIESTGGSSSEIDISLVSGISNKECILNFGKNLATADRYLGRIFYQVDNNVMGFWTNNAERMRITSSGNVGIGTTSPGDKLDVVGGNIRVASTNQVRWVDSGIIRGYATADTSGNLSLVSNGGGGTYVELIANGQKQFDAYTYGGTTANWVRATGGQTANPVLLSAEGSDTNVGIEIKSKGAERVAVYTNGSEKMRIDSSGNVGIGTTSPGGSRLAVLNGGAQAVFSVVDSANGRVQIGTTDFGVSNSLAADLQITNQALSGTVGMTLNVGDATNSGNIYWRSNTSNNTVQIVGNPGNNYLAFATNAAERMRIDSSGNVGIGTSSPATFTNGLAVAGSGNDGDVTVINNTAGAWSFKKVRSDNSNAMGIYDPTGFGVMALYTTGVERMRIDSSGNVGIGKSPTGGYKLDVVGAIGGPSANFAIYPSPGVSAKRTLSLSNNANATLHLDHDGGYNRFGCDNVFQHFAFTAGGSTAGDINVVFKGDGNVGIGTTSPAKQFEITKASRALIGTLTDGATITPDFDANQNFTVTLGGNRTLANPTNVDAGQTGSIFVVQDATGGRTLSFGSYWKFAGGTAPTLSTGTNAVDRIDYIVKSSTEIHAVASLNLS